MSKKYFGTDGIRGTVNKGNINGEMFFRFGLAAGTFFKNQKKTKQTAIIAKDTRLSGYTLEPALVSGLASAGMHVYTLGPLPTNGLAMLTKSMKANMGIMITASHNPYYDNGLKLFGPDGLKLSDKIEKKIEDLIDQRISSKLNKPKYLGRVKRSMVQTEDDKKLTAYHEAGHAIVSLNEKADDPIHKATILPRGRALGMVMTLPERDKYSKSREYMKSQISKAMGGRVAEEIIFGHDKVTSGARQDIKMATAEARHMVTEAGMSDLLGPLAYGDNQDEVFLGRSVARNQQMSEETAKKVDAEIKKLVDEGYQKAKKILTDKIDDLHKLAKNLLLYETLTGEEIRDLVLKNKPIERSKEEDFSEEEKNSALDTMGLKPKIVH